MYMVPCMQPILKGTIRDCVHHRCQLGSGSVIQLRSLGSWYIKGTDEPVTVADSLVSLMRHDPDH